MLFKTPQEDVFLTGSGDDIPVSATPASPEANARFPHEILQKEIELLRAILAIVRSQVGVVAKSGGTWVNASARSQVGVPVVEIRSTAGRLISR